MFVHLLWAHLKSARQIQRVTMLVMSPPRWHLCSSWSSLRNQSFTFEMFDHRSLSCPKYYFPIIKFVGPADSLSESYDSLRIFPDFFDVFSCTVINACMSALTTILCASPVKTTLIGKDASDEWPRTLLFLSGLDLLTYCARNRHIIKQVVRKNFTEPGWNNSCREG